VLDITPNDPDAMAGKAAIYHAQGDLREAAKWVSGINDQTPSDTGFGIKVFQFELERNYGEAIRLLQARLDQSRPRYEKATIQMGLAFVRRFGGDTIGAKADAERARNAFEQLYKQQPDNVHLDVAVSLSQAYAVMGAKESALTVAEHAFTLPLAKDPLVVAALQENLAAIQTIIGENKQAISTLTQLLQTSYKSWNDYSITPITPALLRLDPLWDPLRSDPAFQKLCEEKQK
jgi:serine/threonine-protein kinase